MREMIRGRVVRIPVDDVSTDIIAPGRHRVKVADDDKNLTPLRPYVMEAIRPGLDEHVKPGDIFVVGKNFGCGSHREVAALIFKVWGVQAIVVESAARIWFRNSIAAGTPVFELTDATKLFDDGDEIEIDLKHWRIKNTRKKNADGHPIAPFPHTVMRILESGGILPLLKQRVEREGLNPAVSPR